ncbi:MAG: hypothetical protein N2595_05945, partial [bacterium]|nr:hypothetical protein [bacterium]
LYSMDMPGSATLPDEDPADVNVVNPRQARRLIGRANMRTPLAGTQRGLDQLAVNLVDYRDQNHVLSTIGAQYGVEAVNFNELLANDGTVARNTAPGVVNGVDPSREDFVVPSYDVLFNARVAGEVGRDWRQFNSNFSTISEGAAWDVEVQGNRVRLYGPAKEFNPDGSIKSEDIMSATRRRGFNAYVANRDAGAYPSLRVRRTMGATVATYTSFRFPANFFRNLYLCVGFSNSNGYRSGVVNVQTRKISLSTPDGELVVQGGPLTVPEGKLARAVIGGWTGASGPEGAWPRMPLMITVQRLQPSVYYLPVVNNWSNHRQLDKVARAGFAPWNELEQDDRRPRDHKLYYGGERSSEYQPVRSSRRGTLDIFYSSGSDAVYDPDKLQYSGWCAPWGLTFVRPEVIELINVSARPLSLRGWTLTFNTGSVANDIGMIDYGKGYSLNPGGAADPNPVILPNGYFYLVNNIKLFNAEFGAKTPSENWGRAASQYVPVWEIPNSSWGVQYEIDRAQSIHQGGGMYDVRVFVKGVENFRRDQFKGEVVEFLNTVEPEGRRGCANGCRYVVTGNGSKYFDIDVNATYPIAHEHYEPRGFRGESPGVNRIMLLGMPAKGGIVSMTLKNEYKQVVARTVTYAYLEKEPDQWYGQSAEKTDPTHYNWVVRRKPSINGRPELAANEAVRGRRRAAVEVKDGPYVSVGEVQRVRRGRDFENVGEGGSAVGERDTLGGLASVFGASAIRLEACDEHAERNGWQAAVYTVAGVRQGSISAANASWEVNQWRFHTVRFMTGNLRGEMYPVYGNTRSTLDLGAPGMRAQVRSAPGRKLLSPSVGDVFTIGPGYASGLCYARRPEQKGEWTWRQRISVPGRYHLYIFGLSDSISTTEFLEENDNAALDIEVWNYA